MSLLISTAFSNWKVGQKDHQRFQSSYATILKAHMTSLKKRERKDKKKSAETDKREGSSKKAKKVWIQSKHTGGLLFSVEALVLGLWFSFFLSFFRSWKWKGRKILAILINLRIKGSNLSHSIPFYVVLWVTVCGVFIHLYIIHDKIRYFPVQGTHLHEKTRS